MTIVINAIYANIKLIVVVINNLEFFLSRWDIADELGKEKHRSFLTIHTVWVPIKIRGAEVVLLGDSYTLAVSSCLRDHLCGFLSFQYAVKAIITSLVYSGPILFGSVGRKSIGMKEHTGEPVLNEHFPGKKSH